MDVCMGKHFFKPLKRRYFCNLLFSHLIEFVVCSLNSSLRLNKKYILLIFTNLFELCKGVHFLSSLNMGTFKHLGSHDRSLFFPKQWKSCCVVLLKYKDTIKTSVFMNDDTGWTLKPKYPIKSESTDIKYCDSWQFLHACSSAVHITV